MVGLSNIFGSDDDSSNSSNDSSSVLGTVTDVTNDVGLDINNSNSSYSQDEDGNVSSQTNDTSLGLDSSTDGLLGAVTDTMNSSDESSSS